MEDTKESVEQLDQVKDQAQEKPRIRPAIQEGASVEAATFVHRPVLNVWGFKSPLMAGDTFTATVRAKVYEGMSLTGSCLRVIDSKTGKVLGTTRTGTDEDTAAGLLQDDVELKVPEDPGMHRYFVVLDDGSDTIPAQISFPFSSVPKGDREVTVTCHDDKSGKDKTGKPLANATVFFYNTALGKTRPIEAVTDEKGVARAKIVAGVDYKVEAVCEDYVTAFGEIHADSANDLDLPMRFVFNVKMKKAF